MDKNFSGSTVKESVRTLLAGAIDYAGLFPPSKLSMAEAVINYATYRNSNYNWMLGRFVVTAARLADFYDSACDFISRDAATAWRIAVIAGEDLLETLRIVENFNTSNAPGVICDTVEMKTVTVYQVETVSRALPVGVRAYCEIAPGADFPDLLSAVALAGQSTKIRTGGLTPDEFPKTSDVIRFVRAALAANVPFKATAGLHHPIRCFRPLTYENNSPSGTMHGFLNLFLMAGFAREGFRPSLLEDVMEEEFEEVFRFEEQSATWRDEFSLNISQLARLRKYGIQSFGSCSFDEPIADLQKLGVL